MKKSILFVTLCTTILCFTACSKGAVDDGTKTCLHITKKGEIISDIRESFSESYYSASELNTMIMDEIATYTSRNSQDSVKANRINVSEGVTDVEIQYATSDDYTKFNNEKLFVGTGPEAVSAGYGLNVVLTDIKDATATIGSAELKNMTENTILIADTDQTIYLPSKVLYVSDNSFVLEGNNAVLRREGDNQPIYIVFK